MTRMKNPIEAKKLLNFLLLFGAILIFIAPFLHINFSKKNAKTEKFKEETFDNLIGPLIIKKETLGKTILKQKEPNKDLFLSYLETEIEIKKKESEYKSLVKKEKAKNSFFGWHTTRSFLIGFGNRIPYLVFNLIITYLIQIINTESKYLKNTFRYLQLICYTISIYQIIWCFWNYQDYPLKYYRYIIVLISLSTSVMMINFINYRSVLRTKLIELIKDLFAFIFDETEDKNYIKLDKKEEYKKRRLELAEKAIEIE